MKTVRMIVCWWIVIAISNWLTTRSAQATLAQLLLVTLLLGLGAIVNVALYWRRGGWSYERRFGRLSVSAYSRVPPAPCCKAQAYRRRSRGKFRCSR
ncbi:hypothetical protein PLCT2_02252 [Planctomycetaceae bacterium]|nr:hypothetical protein PLCT2_02252 [Planctomycetaceae bacterium]